MSNFAKRMSRLSPKRQELLVRLMAKKRLDFSRTVITRRKRDSACVPLSFAQERLWFLDQLEPHRAIYNLPDSHFFEGPLNLDALERSLGEIVRRHEILRTTFQTVEGQPVQVIAAPEPRRLEVVDLSQLPAAEREVEAQRLANEEAQEPFYLSRGPLLRMRLVKLGAAEHILLLTMHHIISDGWSLGVFARELAALYEAYRAGGNSPLPELAIQYADFAVWEREWLRGEVLEKQLGYWREQLGGELPVLELPTDRPRPARQSYCGALEEVELSEAVRQRLREISRESGVTLFMTLLAAFNVLLWRYSRQEEILIGTPIANRNRAETEELIGFFVNTLVIRTKLNGEMNFRELLEQVRETTLGAYEHQDLPFEKLVEELQPERSLSRQPVFQVMFTLPDVEEMKLTGLELSWMDTEIQVVKFDLTLTLTEAEGYLGGAIIYNTDLFDAATIKRMSGQLELLLASIAANPRQRLSELPLLTEAEQQMLADWNKTQREYPEHACIHELFETQAARTPDAVAVVFNEERLTYGELNRRANQLAHYLRGVGVGPEVLVGILMERSVEMVVAVLGILKAGGAFVPLNPTYPDERIAFMLADAGVAVLLTQGHLREKFGKSGARVVCLDEEWSLIRQGSIENLAGGSLPGNLAYVIYTSGSSGLPKGVAIEQGSLRNYLCWVNETFFAGSMYSLPFVTGLSFDASLKQVFAPLVRGDQVWVLSNDTVSDPSALMAVLNTRSNVALNCVPSLWAALLNSVPKSEIANRIKSLRCLFIGGESLSPELLDRTFVEIPELEVWNLYGPTESTANAVFSRITPDKKPLIGRPIANTEAYVLDSNLQPVPIGVVGELYIGGVGLARGYLGRPGLTAERFVPHPFSAQPGSRLYRTGDLGRYLTDGNLEYLGRIDHQVKLRGFRIELGEIESALSQHPAVRDVIVLAREDVPGDKRLVAYLITEPGTTADVSNWRVWLSQKLPEYMLPAVFMLLEEFPLTPNGKVDRRTLPAPDAGRPLQGHAYLAPRDRLEQLLVDLWQPALGLKQVGVTDNFFDIGGNSLKGAILINRLQELLGEYVYVVAIFDAPTVADLADYLRRHYPKAVNRICGFPELADHTEVQGPTAVPVSQQELQAIRRVEENREVGLPLSFAQQRLWFIQQLTPESAVYNIPLALHLSGRLDVLALEQSFSEMVRRHAVLRTTFQTVAGEPVQVIAAPQPVKLEVVDLTQPPAAEREAEAQRLANEEAQRTFDLAHGPLLRVRLLRLDEAEHVLLLTMHHIISDGWSIGVLGRELEALYAAYSTGQSSPLPELAIQYADFAVWQREWLQGEVLEKQLSYWREQLGGELPVLELPTDKPRPAMQSYRGDVEVLELSEEVSHSLKEISREGGATLFMTLLAAFNVLLWRYTGQTDISIGTPIAGRNRPELEKLNGLFVNTLVLRTRLSGESDFRDLLRQVKNMTRDAYEHQDLPFEKLVDELQPPRDASRTPLFQVMFTLEDASQEELNLAGLELTWMETESEIAKFDLSLGMTEGESSLGGAIVYNSDLFDAATIKRMARHFELLLESVVANPEQRLSELPLLTAAEQQLLAEWNKTEREYPDQVCIHELFERQAARTPEAVAVVFNEERLSYRELNHRANQLAHYLGCVGVGPEVQVGILLERSVEMIVGLLGVLKAGGAYVPLDPQYPTERLAFMIEDAEVEVLITQADLRHRVAGAAFSQVIIVEQHSWSDESTENPKLAVSAENLAYVLYTSGSTGRPKGVAIEHHSAATLLYWAREIFISEELQGVLASTSICFDLSVFELFVPLSWGGKVILAENALALPNLPGRVEVRLINTVPSVISELVRMKAIPEQVRVVNLAGEALQRRLVEQVYEQPTIERVINLYGPSEDTTYSTYAEMKRGEEGRVVIGRPIAKTRAYVVDERGEVVPIGVAGELCLGGEGLARGYLKRAELTAEKFIPDGFSGQSGARLYRTGDLARYLADGNIEYLGRIDQQVKIRGFRIEPGEIEARLLQHEAVREALVLVQEEDGEDKRLVACVVAQPEIGLIEELRRYLRERLPEYMIPSAFVLLGELPLTPNGKINRQALLALAKNGKQRQAAFIAPRNALELQLGRLWEEILKVWPIGITDNFFDLGGHSLLAVRMMAQLSRQIGRELPLVLILQKQTIQELATFLRQQVKPQDTSPLIAIQPHGRKQPFFCVHPAGGSIICYSALSRYLGVEQPFYGIQTPGLDGPAQRPLTRIDSMAARYIEELRMVQKAEPYMLGGWSMGGVVAFEMAQQLRGQGFEVSLLALIDSYAPATLRRFTEINDEILLLQFRSDISALYGLDQLLTEDSDSEGSTVDQRLTSLLQQIVRTGWAPPDFDLQRLSRLFQVFRTNMYAMLNYEAQRYPGRITLFSASGQVDDASQDPARGWRTLAAEGVEVHVVPGDHYTMLREPAVQVMSEWLKVCLDLAASETEPALSQRTVEITNAISV